MPARGQKEGKREKEEESESGGVIGRGVGANWRVVQLSYMFLFFKLEYRKAKTKICFKLKQKRK